MSHSQATAIGGAAQGFDSKLREVVWLLDGEFPDSSSLTHGFHKTNLNKERIITPTLEALMQRRKSPASTRGVVRNVKGLATFFLENRNDDSPDGFALAGDGSAVLLHDYIESTAERGRTVPGEVENPRSIWAEAIGVNWPIDNPLVCAAAHVDSNDNPKHAPPAKLDTVKKLEELALNVEVAPSKRAFSTGVLLMTFARLRFSGVQRLRILDMNADSAQGTFPQSKTNRPHGLPRPWDCPLTGMTGSGKCVLPIF